MSSDGKPLGGPCPSTEWNHNNTEENDAPRRPAQATESRVLGHILSLRQNDKQEQSVSQTDKNSSSNSSHASQQPLTLPVLTTELSVDAIEFVPRSKYNDLSVNATEFIPQAVGEYTNYGDPCYQNEVYEGYDPNAYPNYPLPDFGGLSLQDHYNPLSEYNPAFESTGNPILDRFNHTLYVVNTHPGNMEEYFRPICEMIGKSPEDINVLNGMIENLFEQSIMEPNFRYTGARICQFLSRNLKGNPQFSGFHRMFVKRCQAEYAKRETLITGSAEEQERLRGLAVFMAEMFLNVQTDKDDGTSERIHFLPKVLVDFVQTLLSQPTDMNVKCSCQLLKLSGALIEDIVKSMPEVCVKFEEIFTRMQSLQSSSDLGEISKSLVSSVLKLKDQNWNRSTSSPSKKSMFSFKPDQNNFQADEPVFYNRGTPCSRAEAGFPEEEGDDDAYVLTEEEEQAFLAWQVEQGVLTEDQGSWSCNDTGYESYHLEGSIDEAGGMGAEVEEAYEQFLEEQSYQVYHQQHPQPGPSQLPQQMIHPSPVIPPMFQHPPPPFPTQPPLNYQHSQGNAYMPMQGMPQGQMPAPHPNMQQHHQHPQQQQQQQQPPQQQHPRHPYPQNDPYHYQR